MGGVELISCATARAALRQALARTGTASVDTAVLAHLAQCATCRTALLLLTSGSLPALPAPIACERSLADLPAFVDYERANGPEAAIRVWPYVWWHLWTCAECLETHEGICLLLDAEASRMLTLPVPFPPPSRRVERLLRLRRAFLRHAFPASGLVPARGEEDGGFIIAEGPTPEGRQVTLLVEPQDTGRWAVMVTVAPAPGGTLVMQLGEAVFRASFDANGTAIVREVPSELLTGSEGPDLVLSIEEV